METEDMFELCIIGDGMIGSGAAYHASKTLQGNVVIIGPGENKAEGDADIFGAWYDEGRISAIIDRTEKYAVLSAKSAARYRAIENESGISFFDNIGYLIICNAKDDSMGQAYRRTAEKMKCGRNLTFDEAVEEFPNFKLHSDQTFLFDERGGRINPRKLREAQLTVAERYGCKIIKDVAKKVRNISRNSKTEFEIETDSGLIIRSLKVLVCTGAFSYCRDILPREIQPELRPLTQTVLFWEVTEKQAAQLRGMPCVGCKYDKPGSKTWLSNTKEHFYLMPPIRYQNGKYYIKVGHAERGKDDMERLLRTPEELKNWYSSNGNQYAISFLEKTLREFFKDIKPVSTSTGVCLTTHTDDGRPIIDLIQPGFGIALGDNGCCAKSSNEIGRIAMLLVSTGQWDLEIPHELYQLDRNKILSHL
ncbi:peroxisomal sarcosine oxidase-like [Tubulanus polymorphus]|uniref:peroxisomal sarcosine oxidase-like n=1 Tax=Tubulanus polymorphus TaxID=672921 RepID=UPI003DA49808